MIHDTCVSVQSHLRQGQDRPYKSLALNFI